MKETQRSAAKATGEPRSAPRSARAGAARAKGKADIDGADGFQDPHHVASREARLEAAIGREVRTFRHQLNMTVTQLAQAANMSAGMLSKIENGQTSPSLATLTELSRALQVPVTAFFRRFEEERSATYVKAGQGLPIERRGTRAGHQRNHRPLGAAEPLAGDKSHRRIDLVPGNEIPDGFDRPAVARHLLL